MSPRRCSPRFADVAALAGGLLAVAVVDLDAPNLDVLLTGMVTRNPGLRVLGILTTGTDAEATFLRAGIAVFATIATGARGPTLVERLRELVGR